MRVVAAISVAEELILCCRRSFTKQHGGLWEFPGGKVEHGESDELALVREISEELSEEVQVKECFFTSYTRLGTITLELHAYFVSGISSSVTSGDSHSEVKWVPLSELRTLTWAPADIPIVEQLINTLGRVETEIVFQQR